MCRGRRSNRIGRKRDLVPAGRPYRQQFSLAGLANFFRMPEIMFEVVSAGLENVEALVLDLSSGPAAGGQVGNGFSGHRQVGYEGIVIGPAPLGIQNFDGEPVDDQGVFGVPQRNLSQPAVDEGAFLSGLVDDLTVLGQFGALKIFGDRLVRAWLAG